MSLISAGSILLDSTFKGQFFREGPRNYPKCLGKPYTTITKKIVKIN